MPPLKMLISFPFLLSLSAAGARARSPASVPRLRALPLPAAGRWPLGPAGAGAAPPPLAGPECPLQTAVMGAARQSLAVRPGLRAGRCLRELGAGGRLSLQLGCGLGTEESSGCCCRSLHPHLSALLCA